MAQTEPNKGKRSRLSRWLMTLLGTVLVFIIVIAILLYGLLYSESGSRWVLNKAQDWLPLSIEQNHGLIGEEMVAVNLEYRQAGTVIKIDRLHYRIIDINWWQRQMVFDYIRIGQVRIQLPESESESTTETLPAATDIELPLSISLNELFIEQIQINSESTAYGPILAEASVNKGVIAIDNLQGIGTDIRFQTTGTVSLNTRWPFELDSEWTYLPEQISGVGEMSGDITALTVHHNVYSKNNYAQGKAVIDAEVMLNPELMFEVRINSDRLLISVANSDQFRTSFSDIFVTVEGQLSDYQIDLQAISRQIVTPVTTAADNLNKQPTKTRHRNAIELSAHGNSDQLNIENVSIVGDFGRLEAQSSLKFSPEFRLTARFNSEAFNPQWLFPQWPGQLNGAGDIEITQINSEDWQWVLSDFNVQGRLKNQAVKLTANADLKNDLLKVRPFTLHWGDNQIELSGALSLAKKTTAEQLLFDLKMSQPQLFLPELTGHIEAHGQLSGSFQALDYDVNLTADTLDYLDHQVQSLTVKGNGQWPDNLQLDVTAEKVESGQQLFPKIQLALQGSRQQHRIEAGIKHEDINTQVKLTGGWFADQQLWQGQIKSHEIQLNDSDIAWQLRQATDVIIGQNVALSSACWQSIQGNGEACLTLNIETQNQLLIKGQVKLKNLQMALLQGLLPRDLQLGGFVQGSAEINYQQNALILDADLKTRQGTIDYRKGRENSYHAAIKNATLTAHQESGITEIKTAIELDDGSFLKATSRLNDVDGSHWPEIKADIDGRLKNSRFLAALSPEIEQLQGQFSLSGQVNGRLNQPAIDIELQQQTGFLILRQTGSHLNNIALIVTSSQPGNMQIKVSADSDSGSIAIRGDLSLQNADNWSFQGQVTGHDFRLLTLPELKLNIDPELNIDASPKAINITGQLSIPMAEVNIKNLPPSAETTSADVVIHRPRQAQQDSVASIPLHYDVNTQIQQAIDIKLLGLQAKMIGQLRVYDVRRQTFAEGRLKLTQGFYKLYGQRLDIKRGELIFNGPIDNPTIDVKAIRESDDGTVTAGILMTGTVNRLNTTLFSEPEMSQLAVLSYLTTGRGLNESGGGTDGEQLAQAAILLGLKRGDSVFSQLQSTFGIDVLTIKQGPNNEESYIEAGQNIGDDLYVGYSQGLFNRMGFWILRYKINDALRLETTQGEDQTVDLIYVRRKE